MRRNRSDRSRGFALLLTLALLALLVLAVVGLATLVRVNSQVASGGTFQLQARQNALLALDLAFSELQKHAGDDSRLTGTAGIAGVANLAASQTRHWCGVWRADGTLVTWLASGALNATSVAGEPIALVANGSVGAASSTSANVEKEHVIAGKIPLQVSETAGARGVGATVGKIAYVVMDEGGKISALAPVSERPVGSLASFISGLMLTNQVRLKTAIESNAAKLPAVLSYEQLALLPTPTLAQLTPSVLQDTFHYVTLSTRSVVGNQLVAGTINLNTSSTLIWRCLLDLYNSTPGASMIPTSALATKGNAIGNGFAAATAGKSANGPFTSVANFEAYLNTAALFPAANSPNAAQIITALVPLLKVRSDTFRVRAYGETLNPVDGRIESGAFCEAIIQRTVEPAPNGLGRRFVVIYFRWLGPDDI
ncbi:MAG: hypothetical protein Q8J74_02140 [Candidatus Didemnitutus sp.]|nr:hypothetical protein [Candidatus Didemnitutus sp.]